MATSLVSNLYPPIVPDAMPAFDRHGSCRIYFSLSNYNSYTDIKNVQLSLTNQRTNASALDSTAYPSGIKIINTIQIDNSKKFGDYNYYIEIHTSDLQGEDNINNSQEEKKPKAFGLNQFYKVQLRFTSVNVPEDPPNSGSGLATWIYNNRQYFSQWSKVCIIKGIEIPKISIIGFEQSDAESESVISSDAIAEIIGRLSFDAPEETEYLKSYNVKLYQSNDLDHPLAESGEIYTNPYNPNEFNYQLPYDLMDGLDYTLVVNYTTNNSYSGSVSRSFTVIQQGADRLNADIYATVDEENGRVKIDVVAKDSEIFIGNLTLRRTSSKSNFHKWEDIKTILYANGTALNYTWYDTTIESGVWYKYCAQKRDSRGHRGVIIQIDKPVMCVLDHMFLTRGDRQLKIKFNPSLNEFKYNVSESQQVTIGNKYPFVTRNGNSYFRSFPIGGLISSFIDTSDWYDPHWNSVSEEKQDSIFPHSDENETNNFDSRTSFDRNKNEIKAFTSKREIYGENTQLYNTYNQDNNIDEYHDYIYEREFRNKVYDFLYQHNVKLFRSTTQGNILIKLTNIDFQPVESLGRRLYSFTATAVQIDEATIANFNKYGIQICGDYERYITYNHTVLDQVQGIFSRKDGNILQSILKEKHKKSQREGFTNEIAGLNSLKLEIESDPYVIVQDENGNLVKATTKTDWTRVTAPTVGHIVTINGVDMIIYSRPDRRPYPTQEPEIDENPWEKQPKSRRMMRLMNLRNNNIEETPTEEEEETIEPYSGPPIVHLSYFELKESNTLITSLSFKYPTQVTINYSANLAETQDVNRIPSRLSYYKKIGQIYGKFNPRGSVIRKIYNKYVLDYEEYYQRLVEVSDIDVESKPGAVVYVKDSKDSQLNRHVLENGFLRFKDDDVNIEGLYFCGVHLTECKDPLETQLANRVREEGFTLQSEKYNSLKEIQQLIEAEELIPVNGGIYQIRGYGLTSDVSLENHQILNVTSDDVDRSQEPGFQHDVYLKTEPIEDDVNLQYVYYYGCWYPLEQAKEKTKLLKDDIRSMRDNEYIITNQYYDSFSDVENPIPNGVYRIDANAVENPISYNKISGLLTVEDDNETVYSRADNNYGLTLTRIQQEFNNNYIYYHGQWYLFTQDHDVICPIEGIVNYCCEIVKGEYQKNGS